MFPILAGDFMPEVSIKFQIVLILTFGFAFASLLGYLSLRLRLSPIFGYLLAGYFIGPYSPGYVADIQSSEQLAEIGVILMMFGVGLDFKWEDLIKVRNIAIPGAIGQTLIASIAGAALVYSIGWSLDAGIILGLAIGVASTVVMVRVLADHRLLQKPEGHIAVGWLIVEDIITVVFLVLIPVLASSRVMTISLMGLAGTVVFLLFKLAVFVIVMFTLGRRLVEYVLSKMIDTQSHELFTVTVLALIFVIATGSSYFIGISSALGAFIVGMMIGKTEAKHQAMIHSMSLKDTFVVIFFLSVGMLFNPVAIVEHFFLFIGILFIILVIKPLAAFLISLLLRNTFKTAATVALALAQVGEFSFILAEEGDKFDLLPDEGFDILVACALISISLNPLWFKCLEKFTKRSYVKES